MSYKKIKDPIYGYIEVNEKIVNNVIDTAAFQRLRNIRQTGYASLYPASLPNRFIHSLGVYHLGKMAFDAIYDSVTYHKDNSINLLNTLHNIFDSNEWARYKELFELACLLHDVGHAPFSHTGEEFYKESKSKVEIISDPKNYTFYQHLYQLTNDDIFLSSAVTESSPHEIMSAIVGISEFEYLFNDDSEKTFFARCITGLIYLEAHQLDIDDYQNMTPAAHNEIKKKGLLNCLIRTLHSTVIDVDRLDYIIRDAITMGYQNVSIDYKRLIQGIIIILESNEYNFGLGFHKSALSVIENAVYAHDNEKKWVQGHPTILYEGYLIQQSIIEIENRLSSAYPDTESTLFSYDSLTSNGSTFGDSKIRYLGDEDLLHLMKNVYPCKCSEEYFDRGSRRLPVWKSEAEFKCLFGSNEQGLIASAMEKIMVGDPSKRGVAVNQDVLNSFDAEIKEAEENNLVNKVHNTRKKKGYFEALLNVCELHNIRKDIVLLSTNFFKSNFSKGDVQKLRILFPKTEIRNLKEISATLSSEIPSDNKFIYLYYYPAEKNSRVDSTKFAKDLLNAFEKLSK
ncbi:MAG: HD domain-containing protein [Lachnospiraceae bacterium]|nr:HD domain-containing protein [Lachnospiraceae bacterium]